MPHALPPRQRDYLEFSREYIKENECAPRLDELANHFGVTSATAHKILGILRDKGYLYFDRDQVTGFYIRLQEKQGTSADIKEIAITGILDKYGEVLEFPKYHGHFPFVLQSQETKNVFTIKVYEHISSAGILGSDLLIFSATRKPQPDHICMYLFGKRKFLVKMHPYALTNITAQCWVEE
jgi:SOS-response transcriptional repressor LexA